ncbi:MAG TPA: glycosyltransferase [Myxococcales bacterium]|jgi:SAM-dependent methyltransferase|nr:glycosyltransferase [Myxococcales bacterium]
MLCGGRRRNYLFVVGTARITQCHACGLVSRTGSGAAPALTSYQLDPQTAGALLAWLPKGRILQLIQKSGALPRGDGRDFVTVDMSAGPAGPFEPRAFDAVFVNGVVEHVADPVSLLRSARAALKPGGALLVIASSGDVSRARTDQLPLHSFSPSTLLRLAQTAGFRGEACGIVERNSESPVADERLVEPSPPSWPIRAMGRLLGKPLEVPSGLLELRATAGELRDQPKLSIIMPVFNEAKTFLRTFQKVYDVPLEGIDRELIIVESNSSDGSRELVRSVEHLPGVRALYEDRPSGKGHAVRAGMAVADGDVLLIQDADDEYDVTDYDIVLQPLLRLSATFVLGSRHMGGRTWKIRQFANAPLVAGVMNLAHQLLTALVNWLYQADMRDPTTMYKVFRREAVRGIDFRRDRFDFDFELVCKLIRRGHIPVEVPINYRSRSYAEGKKVRFFRDPITWVRTIVASRFETLVVR